MEDKNDIQLSSSAQSLEKKRQIGYTKHNYYSYFTIYVE